MKKSKFKNLLVLAALANTILVMTSCGETVATSSEESQTPSSAQPAKVDVKELSLELSKSVAKVGDEIEASVSIKPSNATNKEFKLISADENVAKIENGKIKCVGAGTVMITARSVANATKKDQAKLIVLGTDEKGRVENIFEAEEANIIPFGGSHIKAEAKEDERLTGTGVVASCDKNDRIIWGINASEADDAALLKFRLMGPSGWLGYWDSIPFTFADWYTVKVNGKVIDTENIHVDGTLNRASSADYYAVQDIQIGEIALKKGLNVITFVISNRFDQTTINDDNYNGTLSCWGNIDSMKLSSKADLTYVPNTTEVEGADSDVIFVEKEMKVIDTTTAAFLKGNITKEDLTGKSYFELKNGNNVVFGFDTTKTCKAKIVIKVSAPFKDATQVTPDINASDFMNLVVNDVKVNLGDAKVLGHETKGDKENYTLIETGWVALSEGMNKVVVSSKASTDFAFAGGLSSLTIKAINATITPKLINEPYVLSTYRFEAEGDLTRRIGYDTLASGATYVELKDAYKVQTDVYNNKKQTNGILFGVESDSEGTATLRLRVSAPYINASTEMSDVSLGDLGDLWVNGKMVSTPMALKGNNIKGKKDNFTVCEVPVSIDLKKGKNRIEWAPQNYTGNTYEFLGALDYIELESSSTLTQYKPYFNTDRYTYMDDSNNEPIIISCDAVPTEDYWFGLFRGDDDVVNDCPGSIYWIYPSTSKKTILNIMGQNPHSSRPGIDAEHYGQYKIVLMPVSSKVGNGYPVEDEVYISVWNDPGQYGGRIQ